MARVKKLKKGNFIFDGKVYAYDNIIPELGKFKALLPKKLKPGVDYITKALESGDDVEFTSDGNGLLQIPDKYFEDLNEHEKKSLFQGRSAVGSALASLFRGKGQIVKETINAMKDFNLEDVSHINYDYSTPIELVMNEDGQINDLKALHKANQRLQDLNQLEFIPSNYRVVLPNEWDIESFNKFVSDKNINFIELSRRLQNKLYDQLDNNILTQLGITLTKQTTPAEDLSSPTPNQSVNDNPEDVEPEAKETTKPEAFDRGKTPIKPNTIIIGDESFRIRYLPTHTNDVIISKNNEIFDITSTEGQKLLQEFQDNIGNNPYTVDGYYQERPAFWTDVWYSPTGIKYFKGEWYRPSLQKDAFGRPTFEQTTLSTDDYVFGEQPSIEGYALESGVPVIKTVNVNNQDDTAKVIYDPKEKKYFLTFKINGENQREEVNSEAEIQHILRRATRKLKDGGSIDVKVNTSNSAQWEDIFDDWDTYDWWEFGNFVLGDVAPFIASWVPGYGNLAGAIGGATGSVSTFAKDWSKDGLDGEDFGNLIANLGVDVLTLVPYFGTAGRAGKLGKALKASAKASGWAKKLWNKLKTAKALDQTIKYGTIGAAISGGSNGMQSLAKLLDEDSDMTIQDAKNIANLFYIAKANKKMWRTNSEPVKKLTDGKPDFYEKYGKRATMENYQKEWFGKNTPDYFMYRSPMYHLYRQDEEPDQFEQLGPNHVPTYSQEYKKGGKVRKCSPGGPVAGSENWFNKLGDKIKGVFSDPNFSSNPNIFEGINYGLDIASSLKANKIAKRAADAAYQSAIQNYVHQNPINYYQGDIDQSRNIMRQTLLGQKVRTSDPVQNMMHSLTKYQTIADNERQLNIDRSKRWIDWTNQNSQIIQNNALRAAQIESANRKAYGTRELAYAQSENLMNKEITKSTNELMNFNKNWLTAYNSYNSYKQLYDYQKLYNQREDKDKNLSFDAWMEQTHPDKFEQLQRSIMSQKYGLYKKGGSVDRIKLREDKYFYKEKLKLSDNVYKILMKLLA